MKPTIPNGIEYHSDLELTFGYLSCTEKKLKGIEELKKKDLHTLNEAQQIKLSSETALLREVARLEEIRKLKSP